MEIAAPAVKAAITLVVFTSLSLIFVILRMYTRAVIVKKVGADDYLMVGALLGSIGFVIIIFVQMKYGLGRPVTFQELPNFLMSLWATIPLYNVPLVLCKMSITLQYYRVFRQPAVHRLLKGVFAFLVLYGLWALLGPIFTCYPVQKYWDMTIREGHCVDRNKLVYANAGINIVTDITLLTIPIVLLKDLQLPRRQKYILVGLFTCGSVACITSIIRLKSLYEIARAPPARQSVDGVNIAIWSCIEINVAIMCASVPAIKALVVKIFPKMLLSGIYSRSKGGSGNRGTGAKRAGTSEGVRVAGAPVELGESEASLPSPSSEGKVKASQITVRQSFEMHAITRPGAESPDGSESSLVTSGWKTDCYGARSEGARRNSKNLT